MILLERLHFNFSNVAELFDVLEYNLGNPWVKKYHSYFGIQHSHSLKCFSLKVSFYFVYCCCCCCCPMDYGLLDRYFIHCHSTCQMLRYSHLDSFVTASILNLPFLLFVWNLELHILHKCFEIRKKNLKSFLINGLRVICAKKHGEQI